MMHPPPPPTHLHALCSVELRAAVTATRPMAAPLLRLLPQKSIRVDSQAPELREFIWPCCNKHTAKLALMLWVCMAYAQLPDAAR